MEAVEEEATFGANGVFITEKAGIDARFVMSVELLGDVSPPVSRRRHRSEA